MTKSRLSLVAFLALAGISHAQTATVTTLHVPSQPIAQGVPVLVQASVTQNGTPVTTGTVTFCPAGTYTPGPFPCGQLAYGSAQVTKSGTASTFIGLPPGSTQLVAVYRGTKTLAGSVSTAKTSTETGAIPTATTLGVSGSVTSGWDFTADVTSASTSLGLAGSVSFMNANNTLLETIDISTPPVVTPQLGSGEFSFGYQLLTPGVDPNNFQGNAPVVGDFNGDGYLDVAYGYSNVLGLAVQLGAASGQFQQGPQSTYSKYVNFLAVGDFNSDGILDLVTDSGDLLLGNGDGTFSAPSQTLSLPSGTTGFLVADFDGDGTLDLGVTSSSGFYICLNSASGFSSTPVVTAAETGTVAVVADFNRDGIVDMAEVEPNGYLVDVLLGNGDGTFTQKGPPISVCCDGEGLPNGTMATADMNLDGKPDLVVSGPTFLMGNGDGTFSSITDPTLPGPGFYAGGLVIPMGINGVALVFPGEDQGALLQPDPEANFGITTFSDGVLNSSGNDQYYFSTYVGASDFLRTGQPGSFWFYTYFPNGGNNNCPTGPDPNCAPAIEADFLPFNYSQNLGIFDSGSLNFPTATTVHAAFNPASSLFAASTSNALTVAGQKTIPTITWPTPAPIVFGTTLSSSQLDASASTAGTFVYNPAAGSVLSAGTHTLNTTFTPTDTTDYTTATASVTLTVTPASKTTPTITWNPPAFIHYGTLLTTSQLNATASVPGSFTYNPTFGTELSVGNHTITANFTPTDTTDYNTATKSAALAVYAATPVLTWPTPASITYGTPLSSTQLDATAATTQGASLAGSFAYNPASGTVLSVGSHTLTVTFTPTDTVDYVAVSKSVTLTVTSAKTNPVITWATPAAITYGTKLSATQLDAKANVAGSFTYSPASGTELAAGSHSITATFTPTNTTTYNTVTKSVTLTVNKANPVLTWATPASITYGTKLSAMQLDCKSSITGTFVYSPAAGTVLAKGTHTLSVTFTPSSANAANYNTGTKTVSITVK